MGLTKQIGSLLLERHKITPLEQPLLTLGRQNFFGNYDEMMQCFKASNITPIDLDPKLYADFAPDSLELGQAFFASLGIRAISVDYNNYQGADLIHDLNLPIPDPLKGKFSTILDLGTLEHVFDIRQALVNVVDMLIPNGRVVHFSPLNNFVSHGFWQFSPTMFFDYYGANEFTDMSCNLLVHPRRRNNEFTWFVFHYDPEEHFGFNNFYNSWDNMLSGCFTAVKSPLSVGDKRPIQGLYQKMHAGQLQYPHPNRQYFFESAPGGAGVRVWDSE